MIGVIYARYSEGGGQTEQSIEGQVADCKAFAERNGITIIDVYADRHISGKSVTGRAEFQRMIYDAEHHRFDCVIVWKVDRFGRNRNDIAIYKIKLKKANVKLMYAAECIPDSPEGILLESLMEGLAEFYSADLSQKIKRGIRESAKKGRIPYAMIPIGYKLEDGHLAIDPVPANAIRKAYEMYVGGEPIVNILEMFRLFHIVGKRGSVISKGTLYRILRNEHYLGKFYIDDILVEAEPIISEDLFLLAQERNAQVKERHIDDTKYLLSGKAFCECGCRLIGESGKSKSGKVFNYYKCGGRKRNENGCTAKPIPQKYLEDEIINATNNMMTDDILDDLIDKVMKLQYEDVENSPLNALNRRNEELERKIGNLVKALTEIDSRAIKDEIKRMEEEQKQIEKDIAVYTASHPIIPEEFFRAWFKQFKEGNKDDCLFKKQLISAFVNRIEVSDTDIIISYNMSECSDDITRVELMELEPNTPTIIGRTIFIKKKRDTYK